MIPVTERIAIDEEEIEESFVRAGGPGGQNVNKGPFFETGNTLQGIDIVVNYVMNTRWRGWWTTTYDRRALTPQTTGGRRPNRLRSVPPIIGRTQERI
jgi:hypothetical protein